MRDGCIYICEQLENLGLSLRASTEATLERTFVVIDNVKEECRLPVTVGASEIRRLHIDLKQKLDEAGVRMQQQRFRPDSEVIEKNYCICCCLYGSTDDWSKRVWNQLFDKFKHTERIKRFLFQSKHYDLFKIFYFDQKWEMVYICDCGWAEWLASTLEMVPCCDDW